MIILQLNNHQLRDAYTTEEKHHLNVMTTHMYFPMLKGKSTFSQESHDFVMCLAQNLDVK